MENLNLTHFNSDGFGKIVDVTHKEDNVRIAIATGKIKMKESTINLIRDGHIKKGDVLSVAQIGGIMGAKKTSEIIPMCHNIFITGCDMKFEIEKDCVIAFATAKTVGKTGVEMEALSAVSISLLTIYDMCKAIDKEMEICQIQLIHKIGGKSGEFCNSKFNHN